MSFQGWILRTFACLLSLLLLSPHPPLYLTSLPIPCIPYISTLSRDSCLLSINRATASFVASSTASFFAFYLFYNPHKTHSNAPTPLPQTLINLSISINRACPRNPSPLTHITCPVLPSPIPGKQRPAGHHPPAPPQRISQHNLTLTIQNRIRSITLVHLLLALEQST
jgi:hypothetical protein